MTGSRPSAAPADKAFILCSQVTDHGICYDGTLYALILKVIFNNGTLSAARKSEVYRSIFQVLERFMYFEPDEMASIPITLLS